jgi:hypothetical protein
MLGGGADDRSVTGSSSTDRHFALPDFKVAG